MAAFRYGEASTSNMVTSTVQPKTDYLKEPETVDDPSTAGHTPVLDTGPRLSMVTQGPGGNPGATSCGFLGSCYLLVALHSALWSLSLPSLIAALRAALCFILPLGAQAGLQ
ncbi:hypothetical protein A6R68_18089 [Neotoma lepida]|uniref:Uncharacterized protein n=1 Tax=Neotoma lepida TaxID=56216 RepID=A0A1A6HMK0_NEOLE|nr:hypothetical protein A6R68_18089 [Neotoma lepida]